MAYNFKLACRKALIQALLIFFSQMATLGRFPNFDEIWIIFVIAGLAFFTVIQKYEETNTMGKKETKTKVKKHNPGPSVLDILKKARKTFADSLIG